MKWLSSRIAVAPGMAPLCWKLLQLIEKGPKSPQQGFNDIYGLSMDKPE